MIVGIRGRCRHQVESDTYISLSNVNDALYSFFLRPKLFFPTGFYCYLARFLMRQHGKHHLVVTGTRGSVVGKHYCVRCQTRTLSIGYPSRIWIRYFLYQYRLYLVFLYIQRPLFINKVDHILSILYYFFVIYVSLEHVISTNPNPSYKTKNSKIML